MAPPSSSEDSNAPPANDLQVDTSATASASASSEQLQQQQRPLTSPAEATEVTEMSTMRELRVAGAFSADQTEATEDADDSTAQAFSRHRQQYHYGGTPTSAALAPSSASVAMQQQQQQMPQQQQTQQPQQWTVEENGVKVQVTSHQATDGTMTLTLPSGAVVTLQAAPQPQQQAQGQAVPAHTQIPTQQSVPFPPSAEHSMGFLPLGTFQGNRISSDGGDAPPAQHQQPISTGGDSNSSGDDQAANTTNDIDLRVPFVPSLNTTASGNMTTATGAADDSVQYIDPLSSRIQVGGGGGDGSINNHEEGKVSAESVGSSSNDDDQIPPALSNVDSADAAAGDGSPQKKSQKHDGQQIHRTASRASLGSQTIDGEQVTVLRAHALPNSSVIISSREGSVVEEQHDVEVLHKTMSVSSGSNTHSANSHGHSSGGSKSMGSSKLSGSSDPDLAAGGSGGGDLPAVDSEFARKSEDDLPNEAAEAATQTTDGASAATQQTKPAVAAAPPKTEEEYKPLWLKAREEGREEESMQSDPSKVYFVMNKQSNRKTEYFVSSGKDLPGLPHKDSAETDKPPSQIAMEENLRRAQKEAAEAAAIQQQQLEELAYLREMQRRHAELEGQYIYHDDDMTEVSELTMGVHELGIGPSIAHTDANGNSNTNADAGDTDDVPDVVQSESYAQSVDWNNLTEEQKKQISSDMASRNGGAVGLPDNEQLVETMVNIFTPELCHKAEPTKKLVRGLGALQPIHSTRSINMYQHKRSGRGRGGRGGYYRPAAAAASSAQLPSINDVEYPSSPKSNGPTSSGGSTGDANSTTSSQRKIAKPISPLKSLKSVRGLHGGIN